MIGDLSLRATRRRWILIRKIILRTLLLLLGAAAIIVMSGAGDQWQALFKLAFASYQAMELRVGMTFQLLSLAWGSAKHLPSKSTALSCSLPSFFALDFPTAIWPLIILSLLVLLFLGLVFFWCRLRPAFFKQARADIFLAGGLTIGYALFAFLNLGSCQMPQTYFKPSSPPSPIYLDLGSVVQLEKINYFLGLGSGIYHIDFGEDLSAWEKGLELAQEHNYSMLEWRQEEINVRARYVRVRLIKGNCELGEIAFFTAGNFIPLKTTVIALSQAPLLPGAQFICDESERVPYTPSFMNSMYFDETYHARAAWEYSQGRDSSETTHPPLGKLLIALGIKIFGFHPFGFRFWGALFGILMIPLLYALALRLFKDRFWAFAASFLFAFDFMHFTQTRLATIDVFAVFWILAIFYFTYRACELNPFSCRLSHLAFFLALAGLSFGLGAATKWIVLYAGVGVAFWLIIHFSKAALCFYRENNSSLLGKKMSPPKGKAQVLKRKNLLKKLWQRLGLIFGLCLLFFIIVPALIYFFSYLPFLKIRAPLNSHKSVWELVVDEQRFMYDYHAKLEATHPFSSRWFEWPFISRPIWYYSGQKVLPAEYTSSIAALGNPAIWWLGIIAVFISIFVFLKTKKQELLFLLVAFGAEYIFWIIIPRQLTFIYHFFASVPFMILILIYLAQYIEKTLPNVRFYFFFYLALVFLLFTFFYPVLAGFTVETAYVKNYLRWFPAWYF